MQYLLVHGRVERAEPRSGLSAAHSSPRPLANVVQNTSPASPAAESFMRRLMAAAVGKLSQSSQVHAWVILCALTIIGNRCAAMVWSPMAEWQNTSARLFKAGQNA